VPDKTYNTIIEIGQANRLHWLATCSHVHANYISVIVTGEYKHGKETHLTG
jgi:hypothetical protein